MKRLILLLVLVVLLAVMAAAPASDTSGPLLDSNMPEEATTMRQAEAGNSSASACITITMTGMPDE